MNMLLWIIAAIVALIALYVLIGRPWLKAHAPGFFNAIEPIEIALWEKSETILWSRVKVLAGTILTTLAQLGAIDLTPLLPFLPEEYRALAGMLISMSPMLIALDGLIGERLRRGTTKPLPLVAVPDAIAATSPVMLAAEATKVEAVAAVEDAKAAGTV